MTGQNMHVSYFQILKYYIKQIGTPYACFFPTLHILTCDGLSQSFTPKDSVVAILAFNFTNLELTNT